MTLNDFIEHREQEFIENAPTSIFADPFKEAWMADTVRWLRSALRECAEKTVEAMDANAPEAYKSSLSRLLAAD